MAKDGAAEEQSSEKPPPPRLEAERAVRVKMSDIKYHMISLYMWNLKYDTNANSLAVRWLGLGAFTA